MSAKVYKKLIENIQEYIDYIDNDLIDDIFEYLDEKKEEEDLVVVRNQYDKLIKTQVTKISTILDKLILLKYNINENEIKKLLKNIIKLINKISISLHKISLNELSSISTISSGTNSSEISINTNIIEYTDKTNKILLNINNYILDEPLDSDFYSESEPTLSELKEEYKNFIKCIRALSIFITKNKELILNYLEYKEINHIETLKFTEKKSIRLENKIQEEKLRRYEVLNKYKVFYSNMIANLKKLKLYKSKESINNIIKKLYELHRNDDNFFVIRTFFSGIEYTDLNYSKDYKYKIRELNLLINKFISKKNKLIKNLENYKKNHLEDRKTMYTFVDKPLTIRTTLPKKTPLRDIK